MLILLKKVDNVRLSTRNSHTVSTPTLNYFFLTIILPLNADHYFFALSKSGNFRCENRKNNSLTTEIDRRENFFPLSRNWFFFSHHQEVLHFLLSKRDRLIKQILRDLLSNINTRSVRHALQPRRNGSLREREIGVCKMSTPQISHSNARAANRNILRHSVERYRSCLATKSEDLNAYHQEQKNESSPQQQSFRRR